MPAQKAGHRKQVVFFLLAVILPSLVLIVLTFRMIGQEKELAQKRAADERHRLAQDIGRILLSRLEKTKLQEAGEATGRAAFSKSDAYSSPEVVLFARIEQNKLVLPWETDEQPSEAERILTHPNFLKVISQAEKAEFADRNPKEAARLFAQALEASRERIQKEYARLLLAGTLTRMGRKKEATGQLRMVLRQTSDVCDEFGIPLFLFAAGMLANNDDDHEKILERIEQEFKTKRPLSPSESYRIRDLVEEINANVQDATIQERIAACARIIQEQIKFLEQADNLQRDLVSTGLLNPQTNQKNEALSDKPLPSQEKEADSGLSDKTQWVAYGDKPWLISVYPSPPAVEEFLIAMDLEKLSQYLKSDSALADTIPQDFRLITGSSSEGESPGENFRGLRIAFLEAPPQPFLKHPGYQPLFYLLILLIVLSMTVFGAYLLWRDTRREVKVAEMRSQFVSSVSHELKTPLTAIRMFAETLRLGRAKNRQMEEEYLDTIVNESERLTRLLNNVLDFSKIEKGKKIYRMEHASLPAVIRAAVASMEYPFAQQGFRLHLDIEEDLPPLAIDRDAIEQAVLNLLHNALKYSGDARDIDLCLKRSGTSILIQVTDRGIGIEPQEQRRIFEKFYRSPIKENERLPGTGLGLALADHIVKAHGGHIAVESAPGRGSTFTLVLPLAESK